MPESEKNAAISSFGSKWANGSRLVCTIMCHWNYCNIIQIPRQQQQHQYQPQQKRKTTSRMPLQFACIFFAVSCFVHSSNLFGQQWNISFKLLHRKHSLFWREPEQKWQVKLLGKYEIRDGSSARNLRSRANFRHVGPRSSDSSVAARIDAHRPSRHRRQCEPGA